MADCCASPGNSEKFTAATAARTAARYLRNGTLRHEDAVLRPMLALGVDGATVLEVGGGVGQLQLELLEHGAARTINIELSSAYEPEAARLVEARGMQGRVERRLGDATTLEPSPADVAILHRVVCCSTDPEGLLDAVLAAQPRLIAVTLPRHGWVPRIVVAVTNTLERLRRSEFRMHVHIDPFGAVRSAGYVLVHDQRRPFWRTAVFRR